MKIIAYCALHYGKPYLAYAIRSVIDAVDEFHVLYAEAPSHGSLTTWVCPDTETELHDIARHAAGSKLHWHKGGWKQENEQRNAIVEYVPDADLIIVVDSDEIYPPEMIKFYLDYSYYGGKQTRHFRLPFIHVYRDFHHAVMHDPAYPIRLINMRCHDHDEPITLPTSLRVAHFGYCQPAEYIHYKLGIHGHKNQLRCTADEYTEKFYLDRTRWNDLHPVGSEYWNAEVVNPLDIMPEFMKEHPYWGLDIVK